MQARILAIAQILVNLIIGIFVSKKIFPQSCNFFIAIQKELICIRSKLQISGGIGRYPKSNFGVPGISQKMS